MYKVDFYDAFDGWIAKGISTPDREFESKEQAITLCKKLQEENPPNSMGEHYGVIDLSLLREVFCGKEWWHAMHSKPETA